ncbi:hypothetical protein VVMO6_04182 [Vibrio vulnificus MO6-24/O]|nr:hypothetical protein VVMO6_04182 [Vibrio vulnificus MO6-24/O]
MFLFLFLSSTFNVLQRVTLGESKIVVTMGDVGFKLGE